MAPRGKRSSEVDDEEWTGASDGDFGPSTKRKSKSSQRAPRKSARRTAQEASGFGVWGSESGSVLGGSDSTIQPFRKEGSDRVGNETVEEDMSFEFPGDDLSREGVIPTSKTPWVPEEWIDIFKTWLGSHALAKKVIAFIEDIRARSQVAASTELEAFLTDSSGTWVSHDSEVDKIWDKYLPQMVELTGRDACDFVKPSGVVSAALAISWHFPTFNTDKPEYGLCFDPSNPCLAKQKAKIGVNGGVLTYDMYPVRKDFIKGKHPFSSEDWWPQFKELCHQMSAELTKRSKLRLVLGADNWEEVERNARKNLSTHTAIRLKLPGEGISFSGRNAQMWVVMDEDSGEIVQLILPSYHLMSFFWQKSETCLKYHDSVWNILAAICGIEEVNVDYFQWFNQFARKGDANMTPDFDWLNYQGGDLLNRIKFMLAWEKKFDSSVEDEIVQKVFRVWLSRNQLPASKGGQSLAKQIHSVISAKGRQTNKAAGFPGLAQGRETQKAAGFPALARGVETRKAGGFLGLAKGLKTSKAKAEALRAALERIQLAKYKAAKDAGVLDEWANGTTKQRERLKIFEDGEFSGDMKLFKQRKKYFEETKEAQKLFYPTGPLRWEGDELEPPARRKHTKQKAKRNAAKPPKQREEGDEEDEEVEEDEEGELS